MKWEDDNTHHESHADRGISRDKEQYRDRVARGRAPFRPDARCRDNNSDFNYYGPGRDNRRSSQNDNRGHYGQNRQQTRPVRNRKYNPMTGRVEKYALPPPKVAVSKDAGRNTTEEEKKIQT